MVALENLVDFVLCCAVHPAAANQTFLIADNQPVSTPQMLRYLSAGMGKHLLLLPVPVSLMRVAAKLVGRKALFDQLCGSLEVDASKARQLLGWSPPVSVEEAMRKTAAAYLAESQPEGFATGWVKGFELGADLVGRAFMPAYMLRKLDRFRRWVGRSRA